MREAREEAVAVIQAGDSALEIREGKVEENKPTNHFLGCVLVWS